MKRFLLPLLAGILCPSLLWALPSMVVRPAPNVQWLDANGKAQGLATFRGQPVVLLIAKSPLDRAFRSQVGQLQEIYQRFADQRLVCLAAFTEEPGLIKSNIPFAVAADGPRVAYDYQTSGWKFAVAFVGRDGNLDYVTDGVVPAQRVLDILGNSFVTQSQLRRK
jgi:hypothetical protein